MASALDPKRCEPTPCTAITAHRCAGPEALYWMFTGLFPGAGVRTEGDGVFTDGAGVLAEFALAFAFASASFSASRGAMGASRVFSGRSMGLDAIAPLRAGQQLKIGFP